MSGFPSAIDESLDFTDASAFDASTIQELDARTRALEAKVGTDDSPVTTTLDYRVAHAGGGLPAADGANQVPLSTGAGTTYEATGILDAWAGALSGSESDARTALGLGDAATKNVGNTTGTVMAGDDTRVVNAVVATGTLLTGRVLAWDGSAWVATALSASYVGAVPVARALAGLDLTVDRSAAEIRTALSTDTTSGTRTPADASVTIAKLSAALAGLVKTTVTLPFAAYNASAPYPGADVIGLLYFVPSRFAVSGLTTTLTIEAVGYVASGTMTLDVLDVTSGFAGASSALGAAITWTETSPTRKTATITLPGSAKIYAATLAMGAAVQGNCGSLTALVDRS